jgi:NSS family neurotransmitter:Na+ symporter
MEPAVAWIVEKFSKTRAQATVMTGLTVWFIGLGSVLSFNVLSDVTFLAGTIFDNVDYLTSNIMLPLGGLLIVIFAGWVMCRNSTSDELRSNGFLFKSWRVLARFVAPIGILLVLINAVL